MSRFEPFFRGSEEEWQSSSVSMANWDMKRVEDVQKEGSSVRHSKGEEGAPQRLIRRNFRSPHTSPHAMTQWGSKAPIETLPKRNGAD